MERRHSTASDSSTDSRQSSNEGLEGGRITKTLAPKVAVNPLQFVKVGPCDLYRSAQEQLKKVEEIKKAKKEHKEEAEEWQSNLDNWKCSRRKRQEHIIERVVEVKKLELEEHERNRRRSKTFSEMMQERNTRGRKSSLPVWNDDSDDLSDLGINNKNSSDGDRTQEENENSEQDSSLSSEVNGDVKKCHADNEVKASNKERSKTSTDSEEYTYERAIQSYVNFAETRVKSRSSKSIDEDSKERKKEGPPLPVKPKRGSVTKIDTFISQIELSKNKPSMDSSDQVKKTIALPKVDVNKRKEIFEKVTEVDDANKMNKTADVPATKSIKERLSSLEKQKENLDSSRNSINVPVNKTGVRERLSNIEKISSSTNSVPRRMNEPLSSQSIKERLSSFEKSKTSPPKSQNVVEPTVSIKERLNSLHSSCEKEPVKTALPSVDPAFNEKLSNFKGSSGSPTYQERAFSPDDIYSKRDQHFRHRSLDSLDINQENMSNGSFERVQSLEDLDYRNYPASTFSGDTDREDSGIHTADVSSSVSQADDYDLHLDGNILDDVKMNHQPPIEEETKFLKTDETLKNVSDEDSLMTKSLTPDSSFSEMLPPILENPLEPLTSSSPVVEEPFVNSYASPVSSWSSHCNNFEVPENATGDHMSDSIENTHNGVINKNQLNIENCHVDAESQPSGDLTDIDQETCLKTNLNEAMTSNQLVSLPASLSENSKESSDIQKSLNDFGNTLLNHSEPLSNYEGSATPPVTNIFQNNSSFSELSLYKIDQPVNPIMPYEKVKLDRNVPIVNQLTEIVVETEPSCLFPLSSAVLEPPKEKPPPPPVENSDEETEKTPSKAKSLRRLDSTKRIKKELRQKRSSFLGLEGNDDDSYLEPELELIRPPDMTTLLAEERRVERQLYRQSVCSESDSNQESRDSGVELDHKHHDIWSHSRNDSETFGNQSTTSDEDEIMKKEREIIETLEQEEKIRKQDLGEKLAMRLRELEAEKERWEHLQVESTRNTQNHTFPKHNHASADNLDKCHGQELEADWCTPRSSLQDISQLEQPVLDYRGDYRKSLGDLSAHRHQPNVRYASHRRSMPNLQEVAPRRPPPPPPVLPMKPLQLTHQVHSQPVPQHIPVVPQQRIINPQMANQQINGSPNSGSGQMTRQTLQALSAAPRSRLISGDSWQVRKKQQRPDAYNYQHWLIQEAEHRRITEQHERSAVMRRPEGSRQGGWPTSTPQQQSHQQWGQPAKGKHLPDAIIQTLTQRVQSRLTDPNNNRRRQEVSSEVPYQMSQNECAKEKMLSVSGKKRCSHCGDELGRGAAMIIESLQLFYHIDCFKCCVCCIQLGDGLNGTDVRVRNNKLHCHNCYSSDDGAKFSCV